jgi:transposase-like protein
MATRGASKSAVSRWFVAKTAAQLAAWRSTTLDALDLVALLIDGVHIGEHCIVVALGIDHTGGKHALGLWDGSTKNAAVCQSLLADLQSRGLRTDRSLLVILDGSKALHKAVTQTFGIVALIHRWIRRSSEPRCVLAISNSASRCQWRTSRRMSRHPEDHINIDDLVAV